MHGVTEKNMNGDIVKMSCIAKENLFDILLSRSDNLPNHEQVFYPVITDQENKKILVARPGGKCMYWLMMDDLEAPGRPGAG